MGRLAVRFQLSAVSVQMNADRWATTDSGPLFPSCGWVRFEKFLFRRRFIGRRTGLFAFMGPGYAGRFWRCWRCASKLLTKSKKETPDFLYRIYPGLPNVRLGVSPVRLREAAPRFSL